eukprot:Skav206844  [mRNA]  locus=scaffold637:327685:335540:- [translate_table: standard]
MHTFYKYSLDAYLMAAWCVGGGFAVDTQLASVVTRAVNSVTLRKPKEVKEDAKVEETTEAEGGEDEARAASSMPPMEGDEEGDEEDVVEEAPPEEEEEEEIIELTGKELKLRVDLHLSSEAPEHHHLVRVELHPSRAPGLGQVDGGQHDVHEHPGPGPELRAAVNKGWWGLPRQGSTRAGSSGTEDSLGWKRWYSEEKAENADLPRSARDLNQFQRLFLLRVMRQDRLGTQRSGTTKRGEALVKSW